MVNLLWKFKIKAHLYLLFSEFLLYTPSLSYTYYYTRSSLLISKKWKKHLLEWRWLYINVVCHRIAYFHKSFLSQFTCICTKLKRKFFFSKNKYQIRLDIWLFQKQKHIQRLRTLKHFKFSKQIYLLLFPSGKYNLFLCNIGKFFRHVRSLVSISLPLRL